MIEGKWYPPGSDISIPLALRRQCLGIGRDEIDNISWQVIVLEGGEPAASGRIWWQDGDFRIGAIGVLAEHRKKGLGDLVVRILLYKAGEHHAKRVLVQADGEAAVFYEKYGFERADEKCAGGMMIWHSDNPMIPPCQRR